MAGAFRLSQQHRLEPSIREARPMPTRSEPPLFTYEIEESDTFTEVIIHKNGHQHLYWRTRQPADEHLIIQIETLMSRMRRQFMGEARAAEQFV